MINYKRHISPILDRLDSETMHKLTANLLHIAGKIPGGLWLLRAIFHPEDAAHFAKLKSEVAGIEFDSPVMVGAGWDKDAKAVFALRAIGFGAVEIGGVVEKYQFGRPKPRQFIIGPGVAVNRLGFNSPGVDVVKDNMQPYRNSGIVIGVNVARNENVPDHDAPKAYAHIVEKLYAEGAYFTINVSCPNTPNLLHLQEKTFLTDIVTTVQETMDRLGGRKPLFIKISPDLTTTALSDVIQVVLDCKADGIVATNTTVSSELKGKYGPRWANESGGFSGDDEDYRNMTLRCISQIYKETDGKLPIIGVGGVKDGKTALEKIRAGASIVQVVTGLRGEGLGVAYKIKTELLQWMNENGVESLAQIRGKGPL